MQVKKKCMKSITKQVCCFVTDPKSRMFISKLPANTFYSFKGFYEQYVTVLVSITFKCQFLTFQAFREIIGKKC